jgi:hypothetical protein
MCLCFSLALKVIFSSSLTCLDESLLGKGSTYTDRQTLQRRSVLSCSLQLSMAVLSLCGILFLEPSLPQGKGPSPLGSLSLGIDSHQGIGAERCLSPFTFVLREHVRLGNSQGVMNRLVSLKAEKSKGMALGRISYCFNS